jgi:hypothetical protein
MCTAKTNFYLAVNVCLRKVQYGDHFGGFKSNIENFLRSVGKIRKKSIFKIVGTEDFELRCWILMNNNISMICPGNVFGLLRRPRENGYIL